MQGTHQEDRMSHEQPNMTATEIANAKLPEAPGQSLLQPLVERELDLVITLQRLTPAECLAKWGPAGLTSSSKHER